MSDTLARLLAEATIRNQLRSEMKCACSACVNWVLKAEPKQTVFPVGAVLA